EGWSLDTVHLAAERILYKSSAPFKLKPVEENTVPSWLWRRLADDKAKDAKPFAEISMKQACNRLAGSWAYHAWKSGLFDSETDAEIFHDEMRYMLAARIISPSIDQWQSAGLNWAYGQEAIVSAPAMPSVSIVDIQDTASAAEISAKQNQIDKQAM